MTAKIVIPISRLKQLLRLKQKTGYSKREVAKIGGFGFSAFRCRLIEAGLWKQDRRGSKIGTLRPHKWKTNCPVGHEMSGSNLMVHYVKGRRRRKCKACHRAHSRNYARRMALKF